MIKRDFYLEKIKDNMWNGEIKVITGIRRCGKSVLIFELFYEYLLENGTEEAQIIKIELDQRRYYQYRNPITLCEYIEKIVNEDKNKKIYIFIDEVQFTTKVTDKVNKDIVERNNLEREDILNDILDFLASQIGSLTNPSNIANACYPPFGNYNFNRLGIQPFLL